MACAQLLSIASPHSQWYYCVTCTDKHIRAVAVMFIRDVQVLVNPTTEKLVILSSSIIISECMKQQRYAIYVMVA